MPDDKITTALANFFYEAWHQYLNEPTEDLETLLVETPLVEEYELTEEDVADEVYEGEEGDTVYVLSDLGKAALNLAKDED